MLFPHQSTKSAWCCFLFGLALFLCYPLETLGALRDKHLQKLGFEGCQFLEGRLFGITRKPLGHGGLRELGFERERTAARYERAPFIIFGCWGLAVGYLARSAQKVSKCAIFDHYWQGVPSDCQWCSMFAHALACGNAWRRLLLDCQKLSKLT